MAALVAAALAQIGDRSAWLAAILADRWRRPVLVIAMALLALLCASALAAIAGGLIGPRLSPNAQRLFLAAALLTQGVGAFVAARPPERLNGWRVGPWLTSALGLFILAFGDGAQFIVMALAARSPLPWLAAVGGTIGALAVIAPAAIMGEAAWRRLPLQRVRIVVGILFVVVGAVLALRALRLV